MTKAILAPAFAAALLLGTTAIPPAFAQGQQPGAAAPATEWRVNPIKGPDGKQAYCIAEAKFTSNLVLIIARTARGDVNLAIGIPQAGMKPGTKFPLTVSLDGKLQRKLDGVATDPQLLVLNAGADAELFEGLRRGSRLTIQGPQDTTAFQLKGTGKALADLKACADKGGAPAAQGAAAQPQRPPIPPPLRQVLMRAGIQELQLLDMEKLPPEQRPADFAWRIGPVFGGLRELPAPKDSDVTKLSDTYLDGLKGRCPGAFSATPAAAGKAGAVEFRNAEATCTQGEGKVINVSMLFYLTDTGLFTVFFHEAEDANKEQARKIRDDIGGVIRQLAEAEPKQTAPKPPGG